MPAGAATTITVNTTSDVIGDDGFCSLREAVIAANTNTASGATFGECPAGSGSDEIRIDSSLSPPVTFMLTLTGTGEDSALTGDLDILSNITIVGDGPSATIVDGNGTDRVFDVRLAANLTLSGITVRNGNPGIGFAGGGLRALGLLSLNDSVVQNNTGGGVSVDGGGLTMGNVNVDDNTGGYGIEVQNQAQMSFVSGQVNGNQGGGIRTYNSSATLSNLQIISNSLGGGLNHSTLGPSTYRVTLRYSTIMSNTATSGAGIRNEGIGAVVNVYRSRISSNTATAGGGGVNNNGTLSARDSAIDANQARSGGGIDNSGSTLNLTNVTISGNTVSDNGGGLYNRSSATLTNVTVEANVAGAPGTGDNVYSDGGSTQIATENSIVSNPSSGGNCAGAAGKIGSLGHNLDSENSCDFIATGDITNTHPLLGPLQDNGGATPTHALLAGSPAIDAANDTSCPGGDQRGVTRPQGSACDMGAYEYAATADLSIEKTRITQCATFRRSLNHLNVGVNAPVAS
jgi:CSLREA domain-containing protein